MLVTRVGPSCRLEERTWGGSYSARGWRCRPMRRDPLLGDAAAVVPLTYSTLSTTLVNVAASPLGLG
jgi:hypothetical protein